MLPQHKSEGSSDVAVPLLYRKRHKILIVKLCLPLASDNLMQLLNKHLDLSPLSFRTL